MPTKYVLPPEWEWPITIALFIAGIASGAYAAMGLIHFAGDKRDQAVAYRLGFIPLPLMLIVPLLLIVDLGQPGRFGNLLFTNPAAAERPGPLMFNPNSPMNWGSWAMVIFGLFAAVAFADALHHSGRIRFGWLEPISHNIVVLAIGELLALVVSGYSGVLLNVTNQGVWSDTWLMGALFICFSELSGMAAALIVSDRMGATRTSAAMRTALFYSAAVSAIVLVFFLGSMAAQQDGSLAALVASLHEFVGPVFWIGAVGLALLVPLLALAPRRMLPLANASLVGLLVLVGVLAFRYAMFFSAISFVQS
ncbi:MAG TPA: NrfD/PsrC family molybdoenzyme membrane anchor subunit [Jatrophihabitantaceae bacterium]|nr:NrfD/PsrC family molybdoenzyme membrane anchor subunit [Jatrophihabitantaceae bacterium]